MGLLDFFTKGNLGRGAAVRAPVLPGGADTLVTPGAVAAPQMPPPPGIQPQMQPGLLEAPPQVGGGFKPAGSGLGGLLDRLRTADPQGLTFGDKLFAAGSIMQGDSGGAATYLGNQRTRAGAEAERVRQQQMAQAGLDALRNNIDPVTGQLNLKSYLAALPAGGNVGEGLQLRKALQPDITPMSTARGGVELFNNDLGRFQTEGGIKGDPAEPSLFNPDGTLNQAFIDARAALTEAEARGRRTGAPLAPRVGRSGGRRPASAGYGANEVDF